MENKELAERFLKLVSLKYSDYKKKWTKHLLDKNIEVDEDIYSDTIIKVYDYIIKNGVKDETDNGLINYFFKSFIMNVKREKAYARERLKDLNVDAYEEADKETNGETELEHKIRNQVYSDYATVHILQLVEQKFDSITFHCFRLYYIVPKMTFDRLKEVTKINDCRKRVLEVREWLKNNLTKKELTKAFNKYYYD